MLLYVSSPPSVDRRPRIRQGRPTNGQRVLLVLTCILAACGGRTAPANAGSMEAISDSGLGESGFQYGGSPGLGRSCQDAGAERPANPAERSQYLCLCRDGEGARMGVLWAVSDGPRAHREVYIPNGKHTGTEEGSCYVSWEMCSDNQVYAVSCVETYCECLVQGVPTVLLQPSETCPESQSEINTLCGWALLGG